MSKRRVLRGGSYVVGTWLLCTTFRTCNEPVVRILGFGFRIVTKGRKP